MNQLNDIMRAYVITFDVNGNKVIQVKPRKGSGKRGFSVQTVGNLPLFNKWDIGTYFDNDIRGSHEVKELIVYLSLFGTKYQKTFFNACV